MLQEEGCPLAPVLQGLECVATTLSPLAVEPRRSGRIIHTSGTQDMLVLDYIQGDHKRL